MVVAGGSGERFGTAKQFATLGGQRVIDRAVTTASACCEDVVVVLPPGMTWEGPAVRAVAAGGATRSGSVRAGLACIPGEAEIVVVHDAARPLATRELFAAVIAAVAGGADAAVPGLPIGDTLKRVDGGLVTGTVARDGLVTVQTPQAFRAESLRAAHAGGGEATDDAALVEGAGARITVVPGEPTNLKLTVASDLALAEALLEALETERARRGGG